MDGCEYQMLAMRTNDGDCAGRLLEAVVTKGVAKGIDLGGVFMSCVGLSGEVGETTDMIKKWVFHEAELDTEHLKKELGDILWYLALMCESFGFDLDEIMQINIDKLKARYPDGFDTERANHRAQDDV